MKIIINERHEEKLVKIIKEETLYLDKVLRIKRFLDSHFSRADYQQVDDNTGMPSKKQVAVWMSGNEAVRTYTDTQLFEMLQEVFKDILPDKKERDMLLKNVLVAWYNNKIDKNGVIGET